MLELEFHGAAQAVTGSMHLLRLGDQVFALDSGLFQGSRKKARELNESCPLPPGDLAGVLLSHAHIDHSGRIPALVRHGFTGPVWATAATADLCDVMLMDSAHIQEEDASYWNRKRAKTEADKIEPLYTQRDAELARGLFRRVQYKEPTRFADRAEVTFVEAGHILGSALMLLEIRRSDPVRILFTGDIGRFNVPILRDPTTPLPPVDYLITESTYAGRSHDNPKDMKSRLVRIINETRERGGKVIIPAFSVGRTQTVVYYLQQAVAEGDLEPLPIFVDSPLSTGATGVFRDHPECYDDEAKAFWREEGDVFGRGIVKYITEVAQSKTLNLIREPCVILSASGMCEAGRILHHLKNNIEDTRNTIAIVGFMAENTLGRRLVERESEVKIFGQMYKVGARIEKLNGFSAHADTSELSRLLEPLASKLKGAFAVHGEGDQLTSMKRMLEKAGCRNVHIPAPGDRFPLGGA